MKSIDRDWGTTMPNVQMIRESDLTEKQIAEIVTLTNSVWPKKKLSLQKRIDDLQASIRSGEREVTNPIRFVVWEAETAIAHALVFDRTVYAIESNRRPIDVLALAAVCSDANRRGQGLGVAVVKAAFERIGKSHPVSLFQTGVPEFYEKLGGRIVNNRFVNQLNAEDPESNPWWDTKVMITPGEFDWPDGVIDLNGSGY